MDHRDRLIAAFGPTLAQNAAALREYTSLLNIYNMEPETLHTKWEVFLMNSNVDTEESMSGTQLESFKNYLRRTIEQMHTQQQQQSFASPSSSFAAPKKVALKNRHQPTSRTNYDSPMDLDVDMGSTDFTSPTNGRPSSFTPIRSMMPTSSPSVPSPSSKLFALRKGVAGIEESLNGNLATRSGPPVKSGTDQRNTVNLVVGVKPYRYMFEKITERAEALDDKIDAFAAIFKKRYPDTDFYNPAYPSQTLVTVIGRICSDANEGKSNERSLMLETSRMIGGGSRVRIDVSEVTSFSFFPGQIVVLSGINAHGSIFAVTAVHEIPALPMAAASPLELQEIHYRKLGGQPVKIVTAAGPYTLNDNLLFEPFAALMDHVNKERPDILLLMGPFVPSNHPAIQTGNIDMSPEAYFSKFISSKLAQHQEKYPKEMQILLVPSLQDVIHETIVMPQPGFEHSRALGLQPGTYCLPNPVQFTVNEMVFAVNTTDVLFHLSGDEVARNPQNTDRMGRLSKYLVQQRNLHPVYPGLATGPESAIDFNQYDLLDLRVCPDVLIVPSRLKQFAKTVDNVVVVNPHHLSKGQAGGMFATLTIHPLPESELEDAAMMMDDEVEQSMTMHHFVFKRCRVDLVRV
ncbi:DNA-directed DNA polymerase alpha subunit pol12 [Podila verticillata]|nr:DNA-directed DNA polymerase alpha subunit pol12 [Podila verticillata]